MITRKKNTKKKILNNHIPTFEPSLKMFDWLIKPPIFNYPFKDLIKNNEITFTPAQYNMICNNLYNSENGILYRWLSNNIISNLRFKNILPKLILYMNFKSHYILKEEKRGKLYEIIKSNKPDVICLSEALLPININNNKDPHNNSINITQISKINDDIIKQPYMACQEFKEKKNKEYIDTDGIAQIKGIWKDFFISEGYNYIIFANPSQCPYGQNWGNCIITKKKPEKGYVLQMGSYEKKSFGVPESRSMVGIKLDNEYIFSTHLDVTPNIDAREKQTKEIINFLKINKLSYNKSYITLLGDLNALNSKSYNTEELDILKKLNLGQVLSFDAVDLLNDYFDNIPINTGQKYECLFQKCVSHAYSNKYSNSLMLFTDSTDFDHQPLLIY